METRRRDSKSYLLRRELRKQKGVHSVSGKKNSKVHIIYTSPARSAAAHVIIEPL